MKEKIPSYFDGTWYEWAEEIMKKMVRARGKFVVFDVGAGNSVLEKSVETMGGKWIGFDYMPRRSGILELNLEKPIGDRSFAEKADMILLLEVIEHLHNPGQAVVNLSQMSTKGTHLLLCTPNPFWTFVRLKFLFLNKFPMFEKSDMDDNHHVFTAWPHVIDKMLTENGFRVIQHYTIGHCASFPRAEFSFKYPARIAVYSLRKLLEARWPQSKGMSYGVVAVRE